MEGDLPYDDFIALGQRREREVLERGTLTEDGDARAGDAQTRVAQLFQFFNGFMTHIARQAVGGDALHIRQMRVNGVQYGHQPTRGQRHCVAIGHKDAAHRYPTRSDIA